MVPGVIADYPNWSFVSGFCLLERFAYSPLLQIHSTRTLLFTWRSSGWVSSLLSRNRCTNTPLVFIFQQLLRAGLVWILDILTVQCLVYGPTTTCYRHLWPIRFCAYTRPIPTVVCPWAAKYILYAYGILAMGRQCFLSFDCRIRIFYCVILGRFEAGNRIRLWIMVLGYNVVLSNAAYRAW